MKPDVGQVVLLQQLVEGVAHIVGGVGVPVLPCEYVVVVYVVLAIMIAVVLLLLKQDFEQPHRVVCQGKAAEAGCVFGLVLLHDLCDPGHGVPYVKAKTGTNTSDDVYNKWYEKVYEPQSEASSMGTEETDPQG